MCVLCYNSWAAFIERSLPSSWTGISETLGHSADLAGRKFLPIQFLPLPLAPTSLLPLPLLGFCIISVSGFLLHGTSQSKRLGQSNKGRISFTWHADPLDPGWKLGTGAPGLRAVPYISPSASSCCLPHLRQGSCSLTLAHGFLIVGQHMSP